MNTQQTTPVLGILQDKAEAETATLTTLQGVELTMKSLYTGLQGLRLRAILQDLYRANLQVSKKKASGFTWNKWLKEHNLRQSTVAVCEVALRWAIEHKLVTGMPSDFNHKVKSAKGAANIAVYTDLDKLPQVTINKSGKVTCDLQPVEGAYIVLGDGDNAQKVAFPTEMGVSDMYREARAWWASLHKPVGATELLKRVAAREQEIKRQARAMVRAWNEFLLAIDKAPEDEREQIEKILNNGFVSRIRKVAGDIGRETGDLNLSGLTIRPFQPSETESTATGTEGQ